MADPTPAPKLKDHLTASFVRAYADRIAAVDPAFERDGFVAAVLDDAWPDRTFTERTRHMAAMVRSHLPGDVAHALAVLVATLDDDRDGTDGVLNDGFWMWPHGDFIAAYGVDHLDRSLDACYELTKRFTAEFAIRPLLAAEPETVLDRLASWVHDPNEHVRRLVSEGTRPRLPWAMRLDLPIERRLDLLEVLRADPSRYVQTSVANHLNDLVKDDPDLILALCERWMGAEEPATAWIVRRALRNLLKDGHPRALALFGYHAAEVRIDDLRVQPAELRIGETIEIQFDVVSTSSASQQLMVDLVVGFVKANGNRSHRVFKHRSFDLEPGATAPQSKRLAMVQRSTRRLYPGRHEVAVRVNGADRAATEFELLADS